MNLKKVLSGKVSKNEYGPVFITMLIILVLGWAIARLLYPVEGGYIIGQNKISRQGNIGLNPIGGWIFIISTIIVGLLLITYFSFLYYNFSTQPKFFDELMRFFGSLGGIGLIFVAITPEGTDLPFDFLHGTGEAMGFGGLGLALLISFGLMIGKVRRNESWPGVYTLVAFSFLILYFMLAIISAGTDSMIQWTGFNIILVWSIGLFLIIPSTDVKKL